MLALVFAVGECGAWAVWGVHLLSLTISMFWGLGLFVSELAQAEMLPLCTVPASGIGTKVMLGLKARRCCAAIN
jgi:hypothetical protein